MIWIDGSELKLKPIRENYLKVSVLTTKQIGTISLSYSAIALTCSCCSQLLTSLSYPKAIPSFSFT